MDKAIMGPTDIYNITKDGKKYFILHDEYFPHSIRGNVLCYKFKKVGGYQDVNIYCLKDSYLFHREDGPAWESDQCNNYYLNGKLCRFDGPAIVYPKDQDKFFPGDRYHLNGLSFKTFEQYFEALPIVHKRKLVFRLDEFIR